MSHYTNVLKMTRRQLIKTSSSAMAVGTARRACQYRLESRPIVWHYLHDPTFSHFDTIPECDRHTHTHTHTHTHRQTDRQTHDDGIYCA